ncbi:tetratricopeptide repeat protein, partial [Candidatus Dependentiae bacterium]
FDNDLEKTPDDYNMLKEKAFLSFTFPRVNMRKAEADCKRFLKLYPDNVDTLFSLAYRTFINSYNDFTQNEKSRSLLEKALKINPKRADCYSLLADIERFSGKDIETSIYYLKKAIELEPAWINPRIKLSYYFSENNDFDMAEKVAQEAFKTFKSLKFSKPKNDIERYYEEGITGRTPDREPVFKKLFDWIKIRRKRHKSYSKAG